MRRTAVIAALLPVALVPGLLMSTSSAQARPASSGLYAEAGIGGTNFLAEGADHGALGLGFAVRLGWDVFSFLSVGGRVGVNSHEATVPPPPEGEYFQIYEAAADLRLGVRIKAVEVFVDGSLGGTYISTNVLEKVDVLNPGERFSTLYAGGGGFEYQLQNRHYALGLAAQYTILPRWDRLSYLTTRVYLRYTY